VSRYSSVEQAADEIIRRLDGKIILGIPLGLGKPTQLVNALYQKVKAQPQYSLTIYTALSLTKPSAKSDLEKRFLLPFVDRLYADYIELDYLQARRTASLPANITVHEFFMQPGAELNNNYAQQHYMSSNYTHAARDINDHGINVLAQLVAEEQGLYSFSCNPEVSLDLLPLLQKRKNQGETIIVVGQIHRELPFMGNSAVIGDSDLDMVINDPACHTTLMHTPNMPVAMAEHFIGLQTSTLVHDGGTIQIGIGALGDAVTGAILLRDKDNNRYQAVLQDSGITKQAEKLISRVGGVQKFRDGLYGCSEMLTYGMFRLFQEKIIRRSVKDTRHAGADATGVDICLHGGFFLGPAAFYEGLKNLSIEDRSRIDMTHISFVNHLYGDESQKRGHRQFARFINTAFNVTLMGAVVSDQLEDGRVLSGVGGQYNFVAQAHELEDARLIILVRAVRDSATGPQSNIVWNYGHTTIPRHLRDIIITEYGIADLRGKSDSEVIISMLNIADSRFQAELLARAKASGKIAADYVIPEQFRDNTPARLQKIYNKYNALGLFPDFPLGCDFTETELQLLKALGWLKINAKWQNIFVLLKYAFRAGDDTYRVHLERMNLAQAKNLQEKLYRVLLIAALQATVTA
jgi:acyl-CoA hydrolase